jgi:carbonic anhydrase/acetyltransferase-like protein (isoleucine patch superfamily)
VRIGEGALVGVGSCAVPGAQVTPWSVVPAGSVIK